MKSSRLYIAKQIFRLIPETSGFGLKRSLLRWAGAEIGENVRVCSSVTILGAGQLKIGDNTWVGHGSLLVTSSVLEIGANVDIAPQVFIGTGTHVIDPEGAHVAGEGISKDVKIGNGCWLCASSTILPGVALGEKTVVAAGAVVTKPFWGGKIIIGGVPAVKIRDS